jgi:hypothetical protein
LNVKISRRLSHGFTFQGDYVFSKHHESNETTVGFMGTVANPFDLHQGQRPSLLDRRHVVAGPQVPESLLEWSSWRMGHHRDCIGIDG